MNIKKFFYSFIIVFTALFLFSCKQNKQQDTADIYIALPSQPVRVINTSGDWLAYELHVYTPESKCLDTMEIYYEDKLLLTYTDFITKGDYHIASIWLPYPENGWGGVIEHKLHHTLSYSPEVVTSDFTLQTEKHYAKGKTMNFPVTSGVWLAEGAPSSTSYHTRAIFPYDQPEYDQEQKGYLIGNNPQRFAIDYNNFIDGKPYKNNGASITDWYCYNLPVVAAEAGKVIFTADNIPDNMMVGEIDYTITHSNVCGNVVYIEHSDGTIAMYAHLVPHSIEVSVGQTVVSGQVLGRLGNSGNSFAPIYIFILWQTLRERI